MKYTRRSNTAMDNVSLFTPPMNLGSLRRLADIPAYDDYGTDGSGYDYGYVYDGASGGAVMTQPQNSGSGAWDWHNALTQAPAVLRDLMLATSTADYQSKLMDLNLQRAKQGLPPLDAAQYAPRLQVGVAPATMKVFGVGVGTLALAAGAAYLLANKRR